MKPFKKTVLTVTAIIAAALGTLAFLVLSNSEYNLEAKPSVEVYDLITDARDNGGTIELKEDDINSILSMVFRDKITRGSLTLHGVEAKIKSSIITFYLPAEFRGFKVLLSTSGSLLDSGDSIVFEPSDIRVGRLKLPVKFLISKIEDIDISIFKIYDHRISLDKMALTPAIDSLKIVNDYIILSFQKVNVAQQENPSDKTANSDNKIDSNSDLSSKINSSNKPKSNTKPINKGELTANQKALKKLSSQLGSAIKIVLGDKEKDIICRIKSSVDKRIANPSYNIYVDASAVEASYNVMTTQEKNHIKSAILSAVDIQNAMELKKIFGL